MNLAMCEVPVHPVEYLTADDITSLPELPMKQAEDGTYFCNGESTQDGEPSPDNPIEIVNTYPAGTYKAICGDNTYKVVLDDDLRSVPGTADRVTIDAGRGVMRVERKVSVEEFDGSADEVWYIRFNKNANRQYFSVASAKEAKSLANIICTHFLSKAYGYNLLAGNNTISFSSNRKSINISTDKFETLEEWKTFLNDNPITMQCDLSTPVTHQSIPTQLLTIASGRSAQVPGTVNDDADYLAVKGDSWQKAQTQGDNLINAIWDSKTVYGVTLTNNNDGSITLNGTCTTSYNFSIPLNITEETTYYLCDFAEGIFPTTSTARTQVYGSGIGNLTIANSNPSDYVYSDTLKAGNCEVRIRIEEGYTYNDCVLYPMLSSNPITSYEPFQPTMPSPEYPSEIVSVEGEMRSCGWNLASLDASHFNDITNRYRYKFYTLPLKPNTYYSVIAKGKDDKRGQLWYFWISENLNSNYDKNHVFHGKVNNGLNEIHFYTGNIETYYLLYYSENLYSPEEVLEYLYIREGKYDINTFPPYDRHRGNSITLPTLRSLPDGTRDVLYVDRKAKRAWVERKVGVAEFDGSEEWQLPTTIISGLSSYRLNVFFKKLHSKFQCTHFKCYVDSLYTELTRVCATSYPNTKQLIITVNDEIADSQSQTSTDAWKQYLQDQYNAGTPVTIYYQLATPTIEELPYSDYLLEMAQYETNLFIDCDANLVPEIEIGCKVLGR